jgi:hypothetical protein
MARTLAEAEPQTPVGAPAEASTAGHSSTGAARSRAVPKAYELTDSHGHRAYLWRSQGAWSVEADNAAFRRRILRGLQRPISSVEYERDEVGERWCVREEIQPDDRRYANRLLWSWGQIGLDDVQVRVVRRTDRKPVWPLSEADG